jgi:hypothetical protein
MNFFLLESSSLFQSGDAPENGLRITIPDMDLVMNRTGSGIFTVDLRQGKSL